MDSTLFLQSEVADPYAIYAARLAQGALAWDEMNGLWAVYSHAACRELLGNPAACIPAHPPASLQALHARAATLQRNLTRLSNPPEHALRREAAMRLHAHLRPVDIGQVLHRLIGGRAEIDWVDAVGRKLPALALLEGFGFDRSDAERIASRVDALTKIMLPNRSVRQTQDVNAAADEVWPLVERHLGARLNMRFDDEAMRAACVANMIGLLIQSYDAGRGLLGNALLQQLADPAAAARDLTGMRRAVTETLRFDSPIHNTRRVAAQDIALEGRTIRRGQAMLLVLAAANRDPARFAQPQRYDLDRANNGEHLSFGAGVHACTASRFAVDMAAAALCALFERHPRVRQLQREIRHEPLVNARLPRALAIALD